MGESNAPEHRQIIDEEDIVFVGIDNLPTEPKRKNAKPTTFTQFFASHYNAALDSPKK